MKPQETRYASVLSALACALLASLAGLAGQASAAPALPRTLDTVYSHGSLNKGQPQADALNLRGSWQLGGDEVARAEVLQERKFGSTGGLLALGYTHALTPDWLLTGSVAFGHGGLNWAQRREDLELATKWGPGGMVITRVAAYHARFDDQRNDRGIRLGASVYLPQSVVLEAGASFNTSQPASVKSTMPFVAATWGQEGQQYLSLRLAHGHEAYQPIGDGFELQDFKSSTASLSYRQWLAPQWGLIGQGEWYRNPSYRRITVGGGAFVQF